MIASYTSTTVLLGLTTALSLLLCSTAHPASAPYDTPVQSLVKDGSQQQQLASDGSSYTPSPFTPSASTTKPKTAIAPPTSYEVNTKGRTHRHVLDTASFFLETPHRSVRDQILHQCTAHFLELLDSEISGQLTVRLSRLVMMLPVVQVETRAVMRTKVVQVMQQVSGRLTNYEAVRRVIRTAIDDAGLLPVVEEIQATSSRSQRRRKSTGGRRDYPKRIQYTNSDDQDDDENYSGKERADEHGGDDGAVEEEERDKNSAWFRLPTALKSPSRPNTEVDESQIPAVADAAMEAVLDYASEILNPTLVIHQLAEAIQSALYQIRKLKALQRSRGDDTADGSNDIDMNALSSQSLGDHHRLDLLSDDWIWSSSITEDDTGVEDYEGEPDTDSRGQDEDLWDKDMESRGWDSVGHLFEDFEDEKDNKDANSDANADASRDTEQESWEAARDDDGYDDSKNPFAIGIQEEEDGQKKDLYDEMLDDEYDYEHDGFHLAGDSNKQSYFDRHDKRSLPAESAIVQDSEEVLIPGVESLPSASSSFRERSEPTFLTKRRSSFTPDPQLEILLPQLIEPMLTAFIDEDFPSVCKRAQGELMDGIIWSLDQSDVSENAREQDRLALLSELEY